MRMREGIIVWVLAAAVALPALSYAAFYYPPAPNPSTSNAAASNPATGSQRSTTTEKNTHGLVAPTYVPPGVTSTGEYVTPLPPGAKESTATYNLDWTIGIAGKSGCLVCHGDENLVRIVNGQPVSMYVNTAVLEASAHAETLCTECHVDFAYKTPHATTATGDEWRAIAKSACKNCHRNEFLEWASSAHSSAGSPGTTSTVGAPGSSAPGKPRPLCGDCHGGHAIPSKEDTAAMEALHASALTMCGQCHITATATYDDYYHGAAYKSGAPDAPACWQCHNTHQILPSKERESWTNPDNLPTTCGQCHKAVGEGYVEYAELIHTHEATLEKNPIVSIVRGARESIANVFNQVLSVFR